jgi:hypothetical protein
MIVTAPGLGSPTEVKVFAFPLLKPIGNAGLGGTQAATTDQLVNTASFVPFGADYRGGVSLATGWLAGSLGGAKRIIVSQLADGGSVKIFSSGSALDGSPSLYLQSPLHHGHSADFREIAGFKPFDGSAGTRVATTTTTTGANLLVSGVALGARTQAFSNTSSSDRILSRRPYKLYASDKSGLEKDPSPPSLAAISSSPHLFPGE